MIKKLSALFLVLIGVFALSACGENLSDLDMLSEAQSELTLVTETTEDLDLPATALHDATVTWASDNTDVLAADGTVTRPSLTEGDVTVTLTATLTIGEQQMVKEFDVVVKALTVKNDAEKLVDAAAALTLPSTAADSIDLPTSGLNDASISWSSDKPNVIGAFGTVTTPWLTDGNQVVTLTATLTLGSESVTKEFEVTVYAATDKNAQELVNDAAAALIFSNYRLEADVELVTSHMGSTVTWSSSDADIIAADGTVNRPSNDDGNATVTLTATLEIDGKFAEKTFEFTVIALPPIDVYTSIATMHSTATLGDDIEFTGIAVALFDGGYFLTDGTYSLGVYNTASTAGIVIGDEVTVRGEYASYNTLYQVGAVVYEEVLSSGNANPLTATTLTVAELLALDSSDALIHGLPYTITGDVEIQGTYNNLYIVDGSDQVMIYYYSLEDSLTALEAEVGKNVTITVTYYTDHGTNGVMMAFDGAASDITVNSMSDADALAADVAAIDVAPVTLSDITLPTSGVNGSTFTNWTSSNTAVIGNDGTFVAADTQTVTVTFTADAAKGTETDTVSIEVVVPVASSAAEVLAMDDGEYFLIEGTVYGEFYYGFHVYDGSHGVNVYTSDDWSVTEGDVVSILGEKDSYNGLEEIIPLSVDIISGGTSQLPTATAATVAEVVGGAFEGSALVTIKGTVSIEGDFSDAFITDDSGAKVKVYYRTNADAVKAFDGQLIELTVVMYQNGQVLFLGEQADITAGASYTDAEKAAMAAYAIDLGDLSGVDADLTLPADDSALTNYPASFAWATSDSAVLTNTGVVTRPVGDDALVTLTVTATVGTVTATREIEVTVLDANEADPINVAAAKALTDGDSVLVTGIVSAVMYDGKFFLQDLTTGEAVRVDKDLDVALGDTIVVRGTLGTDGYGSTAGNPRIIGSDATLVETVSTGGTIMITTDADASAIASAYMDNKTYTATLTVDSFDGFGYIYFIGNADDLLKAYKTDLNADVDAWLQVGDTVTFTFTVQDIYYGDVRIAVVTAPTLTDADKVEIGLNLLSVPASTTENLTLPATSGDATITWSTSDSAVVTDAGVVAVLTAGDASQTATLTATATVGTTSDTADFTVTVVAPIDYSQALIETFTNLGLTGSSYAAGSFVGDNSITWNYTESRGDLALDGKAIMLDKDGDGASLTATITGGVSAIKLEFYDAFSGAAQVEIYINDVLVGTSDLHDGDDDDTPVVFEIGGLDTAGDFTLKILSGESQMVIDNITWVPYSAS
jgi:hypothetical protein